MLSKKETRISKSHFNTSHENTDTLLQLFFMVTTEESIGNCSPVYFLYSLLFCWQLSYFLTIFLSSFLSIYFYLSSSLPFSFDLITFPSLCEKLIFQSCTEASPYSDIYRWNWHIVKKKRIWWRSIISKQQHAGILTIKISSFYCYDDNHNVGWKNVFSPSFLFNFSLSL